MLKTEIKMSKRESRKKQYVPEAFQKVVCQDAKLQAFINTFHFEGANFDQRKVGELFGVIQITDYSENSAYIPNLIAQVIKKEFFSKQKRSFAESFEAALHKANLALTDLAQHEIIEWIGKINAVIGTIKNNEFHFTQAGGGKILLLRNKTLTEVSKGLDSGEGIGHPIKTFSCVSSGKLEKNDKLIFASESAFESLRLDELKRHSQTFDSKEFDNIISSTLELEAENAAIIVVNIAERQLNEIVVEKKEGNVLAKNINYFGNNEKKDSSEKQPLEELEEKEEEKKSESIEKKHITSSNETTTVQEEIPVEEPLSKAQALAAAEAKIAEKKKEEIQQKEPVGEIEKRIGAEYSTADESSPFENEPEMFIKEEELEKEALEIEQKINESKISATTLILNYLKIKKEKIIDLVDDLMEKVVEKKERFKIKKSQSEKNVFSKSIDFENPNEFEKISGPTELQKLPSPNFFEKFIYYSKTALNYLLKKTRISIKIFKEKIKKISQEIRRFDFKKIFSVFFWKNFLKNQKIKIKSLSFDRLFEGDWIKLFGLSGVVILVILLLFLLVHFTKPLFRDNLTENNSSSDKPSLLEDPILEKEFEIENLKSIFQLNQKINSITFLDDNLYFLAIEENSFIRLGVKDNKIQEIVLPDYIKDVETITAMPSLRLVFLVNSKSVYSYSPVTNKFYENNITLPENFQSQSSNVYLTYIYLLDKYSNQILQYPRATGGFGEKKEWLQEKIDLSSASNISIDGAIYLTYEDGKVEKFFRGKKQNDFRLQSTEPAIFTDEIRSSVDSEKVFVLDSQNQRIIEIDKQGNIQKQFQDKQFLGAQNFWVDFAQKIIYIITSKGNVLSFNYY